MQNDEYVPENNFVGPGLHNWLVKRWKTHKKSMFCLLFHLDVARWAVLGETLFWRVKSTPFCKLKTYMESRHDKLSNELSRVQFGHREGTQNLAATWRARLAKRWCAWHKNGAFDKCMIFFNFHRKFDFHLGKWSFYLCNWWCKCNYDVFTVT